MAENEAEETNAAPAAKKAVKPKKKATKGKKKQSQKEKGGKYTKRVFPSHTLEQALVVPNAIQEGNGGKPWFTEDVANKLGMSRNTNRFFYLAKASSDYGLTTGGKYSPEVSLTDLGRDIVLPESSEQRRKKLIEAFFNVTIFKQVYEHYEGGALPDPEYVKSTLIKKFDLDESLHAEFTTIFKANTKYLGLEGAGESISVLEEEDGAATITVVGQSKGVYAHTAFVIMPFSEKGIDKRPQGFFDEVINSLITPACNGANFGVITAKSHGSDLIHQRIVRQLLEADMVIADLTDHNPNVLFELGIRIAIDQKPVCLIRAEGTGAVFDVDNLMRVWDYSPKLWKTTLDKDIPALTDHIKGAWEHKDENPSYMKILTGQAPVSA